MVRISHYYQGKESRVLYLAVRFDSTSSVDCVVYKQVGMDGYCLSTTVESFLKNFNYYNP